MKCYRIITIITVCGFWLLLLAGCGSGGGSVAGIPGYGSSGASLETSGRYAQQTSISSFAAAGNTGKITRLYQAAFNRAPDTAGLNYWAAAADSGMPLEQIAESFVNSREFTATYGSLNNSQFISQLYRNILHREGEAAGLSYWLSTLESGAYSRALVLVRFSESDENQGVGASGSMNMTQTLSDEAQNTTIAFSAMAMMTGNIGAQSFFPPGKIADYTGFQYLRDNDPDNMGHNTSFLTRIAENVLYILNDTQMAQLAALAKSQNGTFALYGAKRFPLMKAFRRLMDGSIPSGATGLSLTAIKAASKDLYLIDGQVSYDRAVLYSSVLNSLTTTQKAYLATMKGKGWKSWPDTSVNPIKSVVEARKQALGKDVDMVAIYTYASDLYSWYNGSLEADVYFCPERHGTYYGSFFMKDAPAIGHEGYSIDEQLTATAGRALSDSSYGYVDATQAALMSSLVDTQRSNLYARTTTLSSGVKNNIVAIRLQIATLLRMLLTTSDADGSIKAQVLDLSAAYGELDGENNYNYATVMANLYKTLSAAQKTKLMTLRASIMKGTYADGTSFDFTYTATPYLYSAVIANETASGYIGNTDGFFR